VTDGVHAAVHVVQSPRRPHALDLMARDAQLQQLSPCDHAVLCRRRRRERVLGSSK